MNPITVSERLKDTLISYLTTTFDVNRDGQEPALAAAIRESFETPGALFNGPFLELMPPLRTATTIRELVDEGVLSHHLPTLSCFQRGLPLPPDQPLYTHQEQSIRRISALGRNAVVSSGTGSGKTECFLIPILNDLLVDPSPGVRAVIIYPLNALVNDQLDRLRVLLRDTNITFGRYTGELEQTMERARRQLGPDTLPNEIICRDQIQKDRRIPQILITNYAMLEYLLLRPEDAPLFSNGSWKFIVLDEAHTYAGAQGIEVAHLLRRLKQRLGHQPGETRCVATSATLTGDDGASAAEFATNLFGEAFTPDDIIFGEIDADYASAERTRAVDPVSYVHPRFDELLERVRKAQDTTIDVALLMQDIGLITDEYLRYADEHEGDLAAFLWEALLDNAHLVQLRDWMAAKAGPADVHEAADHLFGGSLRPHSARLLALYHLIELGAMARPKADRPSLLPARYHLFARPPHGVWVCINPECTGKQHHEDSGWSRLFATRHERCDACGAQVYPLVVCRTCGQAYVQMHWQDQTYVPEASPQIDSETHYFTWRPLAENLALSEDSTEEEDGEEVPALFSQQEKAICLNCGKPVAACRCADAQIPVHLQQVTEEEAKGGRKRTVPINLMTECPRCHAKAYKGTEIATPISAVGSTPLSVITEELYRQLPASTRAEVSDKPGEGRKLLSFYDSRQGAARFAAFLQDATNANTYRRIIPLAIGRFSERKDRAPDLRELAAEATEIALQARIFHNDPVLSAVIDQSTHLSSAQREQLATEMTTRILAEITTGRRARQSLENLGLISVRYFEVGREPDLAALADEVGLSPEQCYTLIQYLLDDLRSHKVVRLPEGVNRDAPAFGQNQFSPVLVRSKANQGQHEEAWIGATDKHRRKQLLAKVLRHAGRPSGMHEVDRVLTLLFDWLTDPQQDLFLASGGQFQLRHNRLFFHVVDITQDVSQCSQCRRLSTRSAALVCPHPNCEGHYQPYTASGDENFYHRILDGVLVPMRVEEHTAQITSEKGREYQEGFKDGDINVLSCSTTFEMGIDLGDLQAVVLSTIPPSVANYKQRSGRAGRRVSGTAFILSWASERPHDQTYFSDPRGIVSGEVRVPQIQLRNALITQRHVNALLLSDFLRYLRKAGRESTGRLGPFFEAQGVDAPHYKLMAQWSGNPEQKILGLIDSFLDWLSHPVSSSDALREFLVQMQGQQQHFAAVAGTYNTQTQILSQQLAQSYSEEVVEELRHFNRLLTRLRDRTLIDWLSERGTLPSYSFPLHVVELTPPPNYDRDLRLQRDVRLAIREYAPGQEVVANKRIWISDGLHFYRKTPLTYHYRICETCNHVRVGKEAGIPIPDDSGPCPVCGTPPANNRRSIHMYIEPDGFSTSLASGQPAGQYVRRLEVHMRSALLPSTVEGEEDCGPLLRVGYDHKGELLYVNEGPQWKGFRLCMNCGRQVARKNNKCVRRYRGADCNGTPQDLMLGFKGTTDTLHLRFSDSPYVMLPTPDDQAFWLSLMYALVSGASRALQIERRDIAGVLQPRRIEDHWQQTIVLYDNVPGGAGYVEHIRQHLTEVVQEALKIANCVNCAPESSCYQCLRDYDNQIYHDMLERGRVARYLEALLASLEESRPDGATPVIALKPSRWLLQTVGQARHQAWIAADAVTREVPAGQLRSWIDVFYDLRLRGVDVQLCFSQPPFVDRDQPESLSLARHMQVLIEQGVGVHHIEAKPEWQIVLDPNHLERRALSMSVDGFVLNEAAGETGILSNIRPEGVQQALDAFYALPARSLGVEDFAPPAGVYVLNVTSADRWKGVAGLFGRVITDEPVRAMQINDRYLVDYERAYLRLREYVELATEGGLQELLVRTFRAEDRGVGGSVREQDRAIQALRRDYPNIDIQFRFSKTEHDRSVLLERYSGTRARILLGRGLDFIRPDGSINPTYIIIEDPYIQEISH